MYTRHQDITAPAISVKQTENDGFIFVYLDIISPRRIGSKSNRVLKVLRPANKRMLHFENIEYMPLQTEYFDSISILIAQSNGENVSFVPSNVPTYINLHFKRVPM